MNPPQDGQPVHEVPAEPLPAEPRPAARRATTRRKLFEDYLSDARAAWRPGVVVTPAWIRQVTTCSRGLSSRLAATLASELEQPTASADTPADSESEERQ